MKSIGIKLADGSFYPVMKDGSVEKKALDVTTVQDNQTKVQIDLYRSETDSMDDAEYVDTLEISNLKPHPNGIPSLHLNLSVDENNHLQAEVRDPETGMSTSTNVTLVSRTEAERNEPVNFNIDTTTADALSDIDAVDSVLKNGMTDSDSILKDSEGNSILDTSTFTLTEEKPENEIFASAEDLKTFAAEDEVNSMAQDDLTYTEAEEANKADNFFEAPFVMEDSGTVLEESETSVQDEDDSFSDDDFDFELPNLESILKTKGDEENADRIIVQATRKIPPLEQTEETVVEDGAEPAQEEVSVAEQVDASAEKSVSVDLDLPDFTPPESSPELTPSAPQETVVKATLPELDLSDFGESSATEDFGLPSFDDADEYPSVPESSEEDVSYTEKTVLDEGDSEKTMLSEEVETEPRSEPTVAENETTFSDLDSSAVLAAGTKDAYDLPNFDNLEPTGIEDVDLTASLSTATEVQESSSLQEEFPEPVVSDFDEAVKSIPESSETIMALPDFEDLTKGVEADANEGTEFTAPDFANESSSESNFYDYSAEDQEDDHVDNYDLFDEAEDRSTANSYAPQSNMFEGLYDKETLNGNSYSGTSYDEDEKEGGSALPVIVCVICSIICIVGALLVLFFIPSKINIFNRKTETHIAQTQSSAQTKSSSDQSVVPESEGSSTNAVAKASEGEDASLSDVSPKSDSALVDQGHNAGEALPPVQKKDSSEKQPSENHPEDVAPAKENEIVIATTPQQVVPEPPARPTTKTPDIRYKVVWGDTLWDISNAYYKTPWRYQHIAEHNHIKNPNYIQAGSVILIPSD